MELSKFLKNTLLLFLIFISPMVLADDEYEEVESEYSEVSSNSTENAFSIATGYGSASTVPLKVGFIKPWERSWNTANLWHVKGYWEGSFYMLNGDKGVESNSNDSLQAVVGSGVFRFERSEYISDGLWPYIDLGLGLSYLTEKEYGGRKLGTHFQFEGRFGLGVRFGENREFDLGYRFTSFSNADLSSDNHGINLHMVVLNYWF